MSSYRTTSRFWLVFILTICIICACSGCGGGDREDSQCELEIQQPTEQAKIPAKPSVSSAR